MRTECSSSQSLDAGPSLQLVEGGRKGSMTDLPPVEQGLAQDVDLHFERMVREYQDRLHAFARGMTQRAEDAEEIVQDALVRAYRALKTYDAERIRSIALKAWLYQITLNVARNRARRKKALTEPLNDEASERHADPADGPLAQLEASRRRKDLATLVAGLPSRYRAPLVLRYVEGLKLEEVAQILRQPLGTTKSNVHRAINALREAISQSRREMRWNHA